MNSTFRLIYQAEDTIWCESKLCYCHFSARCLPQIRRLKRDVGDFRPFGLGKLANAVHRVVVIEGQEVLPIFGKGIGFPYEFEGPGGIGGKDSHILP